MPKTVERLALGRSNIKLGNLYDITQERALATSLFKTPLCEETQINREDTGCRMSLIVMSSVNFIIV